MKILRFLALLWLANSALAQSTTASFNVADKSALAAATVYTWQTNLAAVTVDNSARWRFHPGSVTATNSDTVLASTGVSGRWIVQPTAIAGGGTGSSNAPNALLNLGAVRYVADYTELVAANPTTGPSVAYVTDTNLFGFFINVPASTYTTNTGAVFDNLDGQWVRPEYVKGLADARWFGAIADDDVDDLVALRAWLASTSEELVLSPGVYDTTLKLTNLVSDRVIRGYGATIRGAQQVEWSLVIPSGVTGTTIEGIKFLRENPYVGVAAIPAGLTIVGSKTTLRDVEVQNFNIGIKLYSEGALLERVKIHTYTNSWNTDMNTGWGIELDADNVTLKHVTSISNAYDGMKFYGSFTNFTATDCHFDDNGQWPTSNGNGVDYYGGGNVIRGTSWTTCTFNRNNGSGLNIKNVNTETFSDISVIDCQAIGQIQNGSGIDVPQDAGSRYVNNLRIIGGVYDDNDSVGIKVYRARNVMIQGVRCVGNGSYGISLASGVRDSYLIDVYCADNGTVAGISDAGIVLTGVVRCTIVGGVSMGYEDANIDAVGDYVTGANQDYGLGVYTSSYVLVLDGFTALYNRLYDVRLDGTMTEVWMDSDDCVYSTQYSSLDNMRYGSRIGGADGLSYLTNYLVPNFSKVEKVIVGQSYNSQPTFWQGVSVSATALTTNNWIASGSGALLYFDTANSMTATNGGGTTVGAIFKTNATIGDEYTLQFYAFANEAAVPYVSGARTNVLWHTPQAINTDQRFYKLSFTAVTTNALTFSRVVNAASDWLNISNVQWSAGGYWPADGVRVFASAIDTTMGWRHVGPNTYGTKAITATTDWIPSDADTLVLVPGASHVLTSVPHFIPGVYQGQVIRLTSANADTVTLTDSGTLTGSGFVALTGETNAVVTTNVVVSAMWNGTSWVQF